MLGRNAVKAFRQTGRNAVKAFRQTGRNAVKAFRQTGRNAVKAFRQTGRRDNGLEIRIERGLHFPHVRKHPASRREGAAVAPRVAVVVDTDNETVPDFHVRVSGNGCALLRSRGKRPELRGLAWKY